MGGVESHWVPKDESSTLSCRVIKTCVSVVGISKETSHRSPIWNPNGEAGVAEQGDGMNGLGTASLRPGPQHSGGKHNKIQEPVEVWSGLLSWEVLKVPGVDGQGP